MSLTQKKNKLFILLSDILEENSAKNMAKQLSFLREFIMGENPIEPENLAPEFVLHFLTDQNIWEWVDDLLCREENQFDQYAAEILKLELQNLLGNKLIFSR